MTTGGVGMVGLLLIILLLLWFGMNPFSFVRWMPLLIPFGWGMSMLMGLPI